MEGLVLWARERGTPDVARRLAYVYGAVSALTVAAWLYARSAGATREVQIATWGAAPLEAALFDPAALASAFEGFGPSGRRVFVAAILLDLVYAAILLACATVWLGYAAQRAKLSRVGRAQRLVLLPAMWTALDVAQCALLLGLVTGAWAVGGGIVLALAIATLAKYVLLAAGVATFAWWTWRGRPRKVPRAGDVASMATRRP